MLHSGVRTKLTASMQEAHPLPELLRFGIFELDLRAGELRKNGLRVRLQEQPFQVLAMLLERPGEIVGRQELQKKLWPTDTFVDFDHGLNKAINKLRDALGDSAESPRFVETIARRGYRFLADVKAADAVPVRSPEKALRHLPRQRFAMARISRASPPWSNLLCLLWRGRYRWSCCSYWWPLLQSGNFVPGITLRPSFAPWLSSHWKASRPMRLRIILLMG